MILAAPWRQRLVWLPLLANEDRKTVRELIDRLVKGRTRDVWTLRSLNYTLVAHAASGGGETCERMRFAAPIGVIAAIASGE
jgi:hypothetical protein